MARPTGTFKEKGQPLASPISVRLTAEEKEILDTHKGNLTASEFIRRFIRQLGVANENDQQKAHH